MRDLRSGDRCLSEGGKPFLDFLAVCRRGVSERARRHPGGAAERADEIGEVVEAAIEGNFGDGALAPCEKPWRALDAAAQEILVRRDAERLGETAQKMKWA